MLFTWPSHGPLIRFLKDERGAVTVDWVVLTAAVIGMGMLVMNSLFSGTETLSSETAGVIEGIRIVEPGPVGFGS